MERLKFDNLKVITAAVALASVAGSVCAKTSVYGHVNAAALYTKDGNASYLTVVENDASGNRFGFKSSGMYDSCLEAGVRIEVGVSSNATSGVSQVAYNGGTSIYVRHADTHIKHTYGTLHLGHGSGASDGTFDVSKSNTWNTEYYGVSDFAAGTIFYVDGAVNKPGSDGSANADTVSGAFANLDSGRRSRVMYSTPVWNGLQAKVSLNHEGAANNTIQAGLLYDFVWQDWDVTAALGYNKDSVNSANDYVSMGGSFGVMHTPTGVNFNFSYAKKEDKLEANSTRDDIKTMYASLGYSFTFVKYGKSNVAVGYYQGKNTVVNNDKAKSFGLGFEQELDKVNGTAYLGVRSYDYDKPNVEYKKITAVFAGLKLGFSRVI